MSAFAQIAQEMLPQTGLAVYGPLGLITCWLMWRDERRAIQMKESEDRATEQQRDVMHRIDGLTRALLVDMVERDSAGAHAKSFARDAIAKIDAREVRDALTGRK